MLFSLLFSEGITAYFKTRRLKTAMGESVALPLKSLHPAVKNSSF